MIVATTEQLDRAERALAHLPGAARVAMARALNRASVAARAELVRAVRERYAVRAGDVREKVSLSSATPDSLEVAVTVRSPALSLGYFPHSPKRAGTGGPGRPPLRATVLKGGGGPVLGAFVAPLNSGLRVMYRTGSKTKKGDKDAIASKYGPAIAVMAGAESVRLAVEARALEMLDARLDHEIDRALEAAA